MKTKVPGFTMIELMLVVGLIGVLIGVMMPGFKYAINRVKRFATERILDKVEFALSQYSIDVGSFPSHREGNLNALINKPEGRAGEEWKGPYLEGVKFGENQNGGIEILDSWNRGIEYNNPPVNFANKYKQYELFSYGPNEEDPSGYIIRGR